MGTGDATEKIADEELRALAAQGASEPISVIVEVDVPRPRVAVSRESATGVGGWRPQWVEPESDEERTKRETVVAAARAFLGELASGPPVWLEASGAFSASVGADRLETIARSPLVRRIHLNRVRR